VIFDKLVDRGDQCALNMANAGILEPFHVKARSKEVIGEETKGL
jgi:hypothetical protein